MLWLLLSWMRLHHFRHCDALDFRRRRDDCVSRLCFGCGWTFSSHVLVVLADELAETRRAVDLVLSVDRNDLP